MVLGNVSILCIMAWMFNKRDIIGVSCTYPRCYRFIRTVMEKLSSISATKLDDIIEVDEFYIKAGLKGRSYHNEIEDREKTQKKRTKTMEG